MATADLTPVRSTIDWRSAIWSGLIAGLVFLAKGLQSITVGGERKRHEKLRGGGILHHDLLVIGLESLEPIRNFVCEAYHGD